MAENKPNAPDDKKSVPASETQKKETAAPVKEPVNDTTPSGNNGDATGYPDEWPAAIPKMNGKVIDAAVENNAGSALLEGINRNAADSYINTLKGKGYEVTDEGEDDGTYYCQLSNGTINISFSFSTSENQAFISFE